MDGKQFAPGPPKYQEVRNRLPARDKPQRDRITVRARLVWEYDGEEWIECVASRLDADGPAIYVELADSRCRTVGVWLHPDDVWWEGKPT